MDDPTVEMEAPGPVNLQLKSEDDPTVQIAGNDKTVQLVHTKTNLKLQQLNKRTRTPPLHPSQQLYDQKPHKTKLKTLLGEEL
jgi:hypothetical protein